MADFTNGAFSEINARTLGYVDEFIDAGRSNVLKKVDIDTTIIPDFEKLYEGKVRDMYICKNEMILVTTDRQSAFDRQLAEVPYKGQVLNLLSLWWFEQSKHLVANHVKASPHPNVTIGKRCKVFPVEFVMRGYITGTTSTSMWTNYAKGVRDYCGHALPEGLVKNQKLEANLLTPTTKSDEHDELISAEGIVSSGLMSLAHFEKCASLAHTFFQFGQETARKRGLILVDTKYEFGLVIDEVSGQVSDDIVLVDEVHTPDSSRYWVEASYADRFSLGQEPENIDKEFLRKWYASQCDPYKDAVLPEAPRDLVNELSRRYIFIYEVLTGLNFREEVVEKFKTGEVKSVKEAMAEYYTAAARK